MFLNMKIPCEVKCDYITLKCICNISLKFSSIFFFFAAQRFFLFHSLIFSIITTMQFLSYSASVTCISPDSSFSHLDFIHYLSAFLFRIFFFPNIFVSIFQLLFIIPAFPRSVAYSVNLIFHQEM